MKKGELTELVVGVDLGATKIAAGLVRGEREILSRVRVLTMAEEGPRAVMDRIVSCVRHLMEAVLPEAGPVKAVGICSPGPLDQRRGVVLSPPTLPGWHDIPLKAIVEEEVALPTFIEHDAKAAALAEYYLGAGQGCRDMVYITVSTGIGAGIIMDGKLLRGCANVAGEIGHMTIDVNGPPCICGQRGCVEAFASGPAIARATQQAIAAGVRSRITELAGDPDEITAEVVTQAAQEGDALACHILSEAGAYLGVGIANLANLLNPSCVVIGGGVSKAGELLLEPLRQAVQQWAYSVAAEPLTVVPSALGDDVGILGAAIVAQLNLER